jgi:hypothetical protein
MIKPCKVYLIVLMAVFSAAIISCQPSASVDKDLESEPAANFRWVTYEAEACQTNGTICGPSRTYMTPEAEASGRSFVQLEEEGAYLEFTSREAANTVLLRHCIPDAPEGGGIEATLSLYVNGEFRQKIVLSSRFSWVYGDFPWSNDPKEKKAHRFFDENHAMVEDIGAGDVVRLQKDSDDRAAWYRVDLVELEQAPPPLPRPEGSLSILDFGALPDDEQNDADALMRCMEAAKKSGQTVWIPAGTFVLDGPRLKAWGVRIQGAGMWYTRLTGSTTMFDGTGERIHVSDLAIFGGVDERVDHLQTNAFVGNLGEGSIFERLWIEHLKCGFWTTFGTSKMIVRDSRIRNLMADGLNYCDGTTDSVVERCHLRNTGDDALATWSTTNEGAAKEPCRRNRFIGNRIQQPWLANGIAVYGGADHVVADNEIRETVFSGAGILISSGFEAFPFEGTIRVENNRIVGTGGDCYIGEPVGGLWLYGKDADIQADIVIRNLTIKDSRESGITIHGPKKFESIDMETVHIDGTGKAGLESKQGARANIRIRGLEISGAPAGDVVHHRNSAVAIEVLDSAPADN